MFRRHSNSQHNGTRRRNVSLGRDGLTVIELAVAAAVMSLVAVVLGGLVVSVETARTHVQGLHEATAQGRFAIERIRDAVNRSGTYRIGTSPTVPGVRVVWNSDRPEVLVVWTGGRESSMADRSPRSSLPKASELVIYSPDAANPSTLVEIVDPTANDEVDFASPDFANTIRQLIASPRAEKVEICNLVRTTQVGNAPAAAVRFEWESTPTVDAIAATSTGTAAWHELPWASGISASTSGLRQIAIRIELQLVTLSSRSGSGDAAALPVFGTAVRRYEHRKD